MKLLESCDLQYQSNHIEEDQRRRRFRQPEVRRELLSKTVVFAGIAGAFLEEKIAFQEVFLLVWTTWIVI